MGRYIAADLSKKSMEVAIIGNENKLNRKKFTTNFEGRQRFIDFLKEDDIVVFETGNLSFLLASVIKEKVACKVFVLNAGKLHIIFESLKKTDKEDAVKLVKFIKWTPEDQLPTVKIPSEKEVVMRASVKEQIRLQKVKGMATNALHSLFWNQGFTQLKKSDLQSPEKRKNLLEQLKDSFYPQASRLNKEIALYESQLKEIEEEQRKMLKNDVDKTMITMSIPGIGPKTALAIHSFIGDLSRFDHPAQVAYFSGFTPKIDQSGKSKIIKGITKAGPSSLRRFMVQAAWTTLRSKDGDKFKEFYERIKIRRGRKIAIVALARKMIEIVYVLHKNQILYNSAHKRTIEKLYSYKIITKRTYKKLIINT